MSFESSSTDTHLIGAIAWSQDKRAAKNWVVEIGQRKRPIQRTQWLRSNTELYVATWGTSAGNQAVEYVVKRDRPLRIFLE